VGVALLAGQEQVLWERWREGDSSRLIARTIGASPDSVRRFLARTGACGQQRDDGVVFIECG
jgi:DNA-binding CsgD family transcriptional regulator